VAKLLIFRGATQLEERELTQQTIRIGRGQQNDLVLEDAGKGVSRNHAEIRFENGTYTLVDLQSQNGIWVAGNRVPSVVLEPGVSAAVGPYRLMMEAPAVVAPSPATDPMDMTQLSERSAAPLALDSLGPAPDQTTPPPPPPTPKKTPERRQPAPVQTLPPDQRQWYADPRILGAAVVAILLMAVFAFVGYRLTHKRAQPVWDATIAQNLVASGKCQEALDTQINPALRADPNNQAALALRDGCSRAAAPPPSSTTSSAPPTPTAADKLAEAEALVASNVVADCQKALDTINAVIAEDANNEKAKELLPKATACANPTAKPAGPPPEKAAVAVSPSQGGLEVHAGESDKAYKARIAAMKKTYEDALALLASQKYVQAMRMLDDIVPQVPSGYLDLAQRRDEARTAIRAEAKRIFDTAQVADQKDDFDTAVDGYRRAHTLDQSLQVDPLIQRIMDRKLAIGRKRCGEGQVQFSYGNNAAAIAAFQDAVKYLPQTDPCYATAKSRLQQLGK
jgi:tetratricopeptide (TPR) repeat protein